MAGAPRLLAQRAERPEGRRRARRVLGVVLLCVVVMTGCQGTIAVKVDVRADGSGEVSVAVGVDDEVLAAEPGLPAALDLEDLREGGWSVTGPTNEADGLTWLRFHRPFVDPADLTRIVAQVSGPDGPLGPLRLTIDKPWDRTTWRLEGTVELRGGLAAFDDSELEQILGAPAFTDEIAATGRPLDELLTLMISASLPNHAAPFTWAPSLAPGQRTVIDARSELVDENRRRQMWIALGCAFMLGLIALYWAGVGFVRLSRRRGRRRLPPALAGLATMDVPTPSRSGTAERPRSTE